jgi:hypothetical protein
MSELSYTIKNAKVVESTADVMLDDIKHFLSNKNATVGDYRAFVLMLQKQIESSLKNIRVVTNDLLNHECEGDDFDNTQADTYRDDASTAKYIFEIAKAFYAVHGRVAAEDEPDAVYQLRRVIDLMRYVTAADVRGRTSSAERTQLQILGVDLHVPRSSIGFLDL